MPPVSLLLSLIPRHVLEDTYGICIPRPREGEDPDRPPTSAEFLNAYSYNRGFMTSSGQPDNSRGARCVISPPILLSGTISIFEDLFIYETSHCFNSLLELAHISNHIRYVKHGVFFMLLLLLFCCLTSECLLQFVVIFPIPDNFRKLSNT